MLILSFMNKKKEYKKLIFFGKKILTKKILDKISKVSELDERIDLLKHSLNVRLDFFYRDLRNKRDKSSKKGKDVFISSMKLNFLFLKIKYFEITHGKKEFKKIIKNLKSLEKELGKI